GDGMGNGRQPMIEKRRAKAQQIIGSGNVVVREPLLAEHAICRCPKRHIGLGIVPIQAPPDDADEFMEQVSGRAPYRPAHHDDAALRIAQAQSQLLQGLFPGDRLEAARLAIARERTAQTVWMVKALKGSLPSGAQLSFIDRMCRVPFELLCPSLHGSY